MATSTNKVIPGVGRTLCRLATTTGETIIVPAYLKGQEVVIHGDACAVYGYVITAIPAEENTPNLATFTNVRSTASTVASNAVTDPGATLVPLCSSNAKEEWLIPTNAYAIRIQCDNGTGYWYISPRDFTDARPGRGW